MSWGLERSNTALKEAIDYAYSKGAIMVAAVGNAGSTALYYPAAYDNVIGVTSVGKSKMKSWFAQHNKSVFVAALGEQVKSTYKNGGYYVDNGTSMASPMIAGVAAVALSINPNLTNKEFRQLLIETSEDLGSSGYDDEYGYGLVNEETMINKMLYDEDYYVSPVNVKDGGAYVLVKNNSDGGLEASSIFSEYDGSKFLGCTSQIVNLASGEEMIVKIQNSSNKIVHFLWEGTNTANPLYAKRVKNK